MITDEHWEEIENTFPGMHQFYIQMEKPPVSFIELWHAFLEAGKLSHKTTLSPHQGQYDLN